MRRLYWFVLVVLIPLFTHLKPAVAAPLPSTIDSSTAEHDPAMLHFTIKEHSANVKRRKKPRYLLEQVAFYTTISSQKYTDGRLRISLKQSVLCNLTPYKGKDTFSPVMCSGWEASFMEAPVVVVDYAGRWLSSSNERKAVHIRDAPTMVKFVPTQARYNIAIYDPETPESPIPTLSGEVQPNSTGTATISLNQVFDEILEQTLSGNFHGSNFAIEVALRLVGAEKSENGVEHVSFKTNDLGDDVEQQCNSVRRFNTNPSKIETTPYAFRPSIVQWKSRLANTCATEVDKLIGKVCTNSYQPLLSAAFSSVRGTESAKEILSTCRQHLDQDAIQASYVSSVLLNQSQPWKPATVALVDAHSQSIQAALSSVLDEETVAKAHEQALVHSADTLSKEFQRLVIDAGELSLVSGFLKIAQIPGAPVSNGPLNDTQKRLCAKLNDTLEPRYINAMEDLLAGGEWSIPGPYVDAAKQCQIDSTLRAKSREHAVKNLAEASTVAAKVTLLKALAGPLGSDFVLEQIKVLMRPYKPLLTRVKSDEEIAQLTELISSARELLSLLEDLKEDEGVVVASGFLQDISHMYTNVIRHEIAKTPAVKQVSTLISAEVSLSGFAGTVDEDGLVAKNLARNTRYKSDLQWIKSKLRAARKVARRAFVSGNFPETDKALICLDFAFLWRADPDVVATIGVMGILQQTEGLMEMVPRQCAENWNYATEGTQGLSAMVENFRQIKARAERMTRIIYGVNADRGEDGPDLGACAEPVTIESLKEMDHALNRSYGLTLSDVTPTCLKIMGDSSDAARTHHAQYERQREFERQNCKVYCQCPYSPRTATWFAGKECPISNCTIDDGYATRSELEWQASEVECNR